MGKETGEGETPGLRQLWKQAIHYCLRKGELLSRRTCSGGRFPSFCFWSWENGSYTEVVRRSHQGRGRWANTTVAGRKPQGKG